MLLGERFNEGLGIGAFLFDCKGKTTVSGSFIINFINFISENI